MFTLSCATHPSTLPACRFLNARNTFSELLAYNVVPIVNENDTVAVRELRFGDNDTLSAQVRVCVCVSTVAIFVSSDGFEGLSCLLGSATSVHLEQLSLPDKST